MSSFRNNSDGYVLGGMIAAFATLWSACGVWNNPQFEAAEAVPDMIAFGQPHLLGLLAHGGTPTASTLNNPLYQTKVGTRWLVSDFNHRVLVYNDSGGTASVVLGQKDFTTSAINAGRTPTASSLYSPSQIASDGTRLILADQGNSRILIWNSLPTRNNQPADVVIGQADFTSGTANRGLAAPTAATLSFPAGVVLMGNKLVVADDDNHRLLVYNTVPTTNGAAADLVIGQADFTSGAINRGGTVSAQSFNTPYFLSTDGTRLAVADLFNHRVLIWNTLPTGLNVDADVVVGQAGFATNAGVTTQGGFYNPTHGVFVGSAFYTVDTGNNRILYWSSLPASGSAGNAAGVIGQANYTTWNANRGGAIGATGVNMPRSIAVDGAMMRVTELGNNRILEFSSLPTGSGDAASAAYGQPSMTVGNSNQVGVNRLGVNEVAALCVSRKHLIVGDRYNHRFLVFDKLAKASGAEALAVIGQSDFESKSANQGLGAPTARTVNLNTWGGCAVDDQDRLYLSDVTNNRILVFNEVPTTNNAAADFVLGQDGFTTATANLGANGLGWLKLPRGLMVHGNQLFVGDANARALIFNLPITANHQLASVIVGQPNTTTVTAGTTQAKVGVVYGVHTDGTRFFLNDGGNNRILVYNSIPTSTGAAADYVIGRPNFTTTGTALSATGLGSSLFSPALGVVDGFLFVPDRTQNRILGYPVGQLENGMAATRIIGQADYTSSKSLVLTNAAGTGFENLNLPTYFLTDPDGQYIWIGEMGTHRVLRIKRSAFWNYVH